MSHVRRKPARQPGKMVRKKNERKEWLSFFLIIVLFVSVLAAILIVVLSGP